MSRLLPSSFCLDPSASACQRGGNPDSGAGFGIGRSKGLLVPLLVWTFFNAGILSVRAARPLFRDFDLAIKAGNRAEVMRNVVTLGLFVVGSIGCGNVGGGWC